MKRPAPASRHRFPSSSLKQQGTIAVRVIWKGKPPTSINDSLREEVSARPDSTICDLIADTAAEDIEVVKIGPVEVD
jgi:hypothetical protein